MSIPDVDVTALRTKLDLVPDVVLRTAAIQKSVRILVSRTHQQSSAWLSRLRHSVTTAKESVSHVSLMALKAAGVQPEEECMNEMESKLPVVLQCILGPCKLRAEMAAMTAVAAQVRYQGFSTVERCKSPSIYSLILCNLQLEYRYYIHT
jgi:hypothetical protein